MTREDAERLLVFADRLWTIGAGPDARRGSPRRIALALEEFEGEHGFDHQQLALDGPEPERESDLEPGDPRRLSRRRGAATSRAAAESIEDLGHNQQAVLEALESLGGWSTDERLITHYQAARVPRSIETPREIWPKQTESGIRTRRHELVEDGFVEDSGQRAPMTTGREAIVWRRTDKDNRGVDYG